MRRARVRVMLLSLAVLVLAACGSGETPTPTSGPTDAVPAASPTPLGTEDPDEGLIFDELTVTRTGGIAGTTHTVSVLGNGALLIDRALVGSVDEATVVLLDRRLDIMGFFRLDAMYGPPSGQPDTFSYVIRVLRNSAENEVHTIDGYVPEALEQLITAVFALTPSGPIPEPTVDPNTIDSSG
ncbi:MAG: hypothetical protein JW910_14920 [Anaerolineae bacterium]|nr:hypothetical protein [Anaerolineae bacterium]